jgi:hypothetical protein
VEHAPVVGGRGAAALDAPPPPPPAPAGATFAQGDGGEEITIDAVQFCRILSGRGTGGGLLAQQVPF